MCTLKRTDTYKSMHCFANMLKPSQVKNNWWIDINTPNCVLLRLNSAIIIKTGGFAFSTIPQCLQHCSMIILHSNQKSKSILLANSQLLSLFYCQHFNKITNRINILSAFITLLLHIYNACLLWVVLFYIKLFHLLYLFSFNSIKTQMNLWKMYTYCMFFSNVLLMLPQFPASVLY